MQPTLEMERENLSLRVARGASPWPEECLGLGLSGRSYLRSLLSSFSLTVDSLWAISCFSPYMVNHTDLNEVSWLPLVSSSWCRSSSCEFPSLTLQHSAFPHSFHCLLQWMKIVRFYQGASTSYLPGNYPKGVSRSFLPFFSSNCPQSWQHIRITGKQ